MNDFIDGTPKTNGLSVASLVTGIVSIVLCWAPLLGLVSGILAIVFFAKTIKGIKNQTVNESAKGLAIGGLVTGIIGLLLSLIYTLVWIIWIFAFMEIGRNMQQF